MTEEKVLTRHPQGKSGRTISKRSYEVVRGAILSALREGELTHAELMTRVSQQLRGRFSGNVSWYAETVKLDLEARKAIERTASRPQRYRLRRTGRRAAAPPRRRGARRGWGESRSSV